LAQNQILIVTPYFVPTIDILKALRSAARRGVDVRIILPEKNNHRYAGQAARSLYEELLIAGVRIFERAPPFIHAKAMLIDDTIALVGTANLDIRSLELNYETTILIQDETTANQIKHNIHDELEQSQEIDLNDWLNRPAIHKFSENLSILLAPIL
jgi:cardiolipin synthase